MKIRGNLSIQNGSIHLHGRPLAELADQFGTPLYVYDADLLRETARTFTKNLKHTALETRVLFASKAASFVALARLCSEEGLGMDVVSAAEIYTAQKGGVPMERVVFHGNNKLDEELAFALEVGVGTVVLDNPMEAERLSRLAQAAGKTVDVLLRVNPGIDAHTHAYIQTATTDSKFGIPLLDGRATAVLQQIRALAGLNLRGVHCHIGSQIFAADSFLKTAAVMLDQVATWAGEGLHFDTLNLGGGFGVYYTEEDQPFELAPLLQELSAMVAARAGELGIKRLWIEPGRALVNDAGYTLYRVGDIKRLPEGVNYLFVDGGMGDNLRPSLYQAKYEAALVDRLGEEATEKWRVAGKYCESGDVLIRDLPLPTPAPGDVLAVAGTGAYGFSMFSTYNRLPRPAVAFVDHAGAKLVVRRQSLEDILAQDL